VAAGSNLPPIIIKRNGRRRGHEAAHGSTTWKIALADFMTAMFIIFLCLWLINQITPEQRTGIADYFSPAAVSRTSSGSGSVLGGETITVPGVLKSNSSPVSPTKGGGPSTPQDGEGSTQVPGYPGSTMAVRGDKPGGDATGSRYPVPGAVPTPPAPTPPAPAPQNGIVGFEDLPGLSGLIKDGQVTVAQAEDGLRIEVLDSDKRELFVRGSAQPLPQTKQLMATVAKVIDKLPNRPAGACGDKTVPEQPYPLEITGHTDGLPFGKTAAYTNWELSADRANASRRLLTEAGIADERIARVTGRADKDPLIKDDPNAPGNRRISITLLRDRCPPRPLQQEAGGASEPPGNPPTRIARPTPGPAPEGRLIPR
jgi:chemotaxis protein MotB